MKERSAQQEYIRNVDCEMIIVMKERSPNKYILEMLTVKCYNDERKVHPMIIKFCLGLYAKSQATAQWKRRHWCHVFYHHSEH